MQQIKSNVIPPVAAIGFCSLGILGWFMGEGVPDANLYMCLVVIGMSAAFLVHEVRNSQGR